MPEIKNNLRKRREQKNLTQEELASLVSVSRQTIISIEKSVYQPSITLALKIAKVLKTTVEDVFYL